MPATRPAPPHPRAAGWGLLELTTVLAVMAAAFLWALPMMDGWVTRWRADMLRMQMVTTFNIARNTAITRSQPLAVCASGDGRRCSDDWSQGWLIHHDPGPGPADAAELEVLRFQPGGAARGVRAVASAGRRRLRFQRDGRSSGSTLTVDICAGDTLHSQVIVNNVGRTRAQRVPQAVSCPH